jgi:GNAT superfamily N-acetyltransferase
MRFLLDTNILIPLEDSALPLRENLANFVRLASEHGHPLIYHPASEEDIAEDRDEIRRLNTLQRLKQYTKLDHRPTCPWNTPTTKRNDAVDNEILYALSLHAAAGLVTEDRGIHDKAKARGLVDRVYTIQTAEDLLLRLHESVSVALPNIEEVPLYQLTPQLADAFFDSLRLAYEPFDRWFLSKAEEGRRAWVHWHRPYELGGICIFARQDNELITEGLRLDGTALKLATFKVGDTSRGRKVGELFLKAAFQYATKNRCENIFIHGDEEQHYFLFKLLQEFGFEHVGFHPGSDSHDAVYLKRHPEKAPVDGRPPFDYLRAFFPHFRSDREISKFVIPIQPVYHEILFPDYMGSAGSQTQLFRTDNQAGNAIKMAYLCFANTKKIDPGDIVLFYRSADEQAITTLGVVESCETLSDSESIVARVKRRTVYSQEEIDDMAKKPTKVILFRLVRHLHRPPRLADLKATGVLKGAPQSITKLSHENFEVLISLGG